MTEITLNLTLEELKTLDKYVELNNETRPLFDKIRSAYPEPKITFENHGDFDVVSYHDPKNSNSGYETYWRVEQPNSFSWWRRYTIPQRLDMVQNKEKEQELEKLYQEQLEREMIKRNLKTSLQELANGDVRPIYDVVRESKKWCEEHPNESVEDYLKPQTPEKTEKSLREAFQKVQQTEEWKETQRKIDEEDNDKNFKNSLDLIREWGEKNKPPTLYEILMDWWINHLDLFQSDEEIVDGFVNIIDKKFIPPSHDTNDYQWNKCLKIMRDKLR